MALGPGSMIESVRFGDLSKLSQPCATVMLQPMLIFSSLNSGL